MDPTGFTDCWDGKCVRSQMTDFNTRTGEWRRGSGSGLERNVRGSILERSSVSSLWNIQLEAEVLSLRREATPTSLDCVMAEMVVMSKK